MNLQRAWEGDYYKELQRANQARSVGNEGMARVCARRAAGIIVGEYLHRRGMSGISNSARDRLALFITLTDVDDNCKELGTHFLMKVNQAHNLPINADLIHDVMWLKSQLLSEANP